jgi:hypothetical protein
MAKPNEFRERPMRKECGDGAIEVVLCVSHGLPDEAAAVALLHWQAEALRQFADHLELIAMPNLPKPGAAS